MLVVLERGNGLQVVWLNGAVARMRKQLGVSTRINHSIHAALKLLAGGSPG